MDKYTITQYHFVVDYEVGDSHCLDEEILEGDIEDALDAYNSDIWDNEDWRDDCVILYPADWQTDMHTGEVTYTDVVISWDRKRHGRLFYNHIHDKESIWRRFYGYLRRSQ